MLLIATRVMPSPVHGIGLFAHQFIRKGSILWEYDPNFDPVVSLEVVRAKAAVDPVFATYVKHRGYEDRHLPGFVVFNLDNEQFKNDSISPNTFASDDNKTIALRDISVGEELTIDYEDFLVDSDVAISVSWRARVRP